MVVVEVLDLILLVVAMEEVRLGIILTDTGEDIVGLAADGMKLMTVVGVLSLLAVTVGPTTDKGRVIITLVASGLTSGDAETESDLTIVLVVVTLGFELVVVTEVLAVLTPVGLELVVVTKVLVVVTLRLELVVVTPVLEVVTLGFELVVVTEVPVTPVLEVVTLGLELVVVTEVLVVVTVVLMMGVEEVGFERIIKLVVNSGP